MTDSRAHLNLRTFVLGFLSALPLLLGLMFLDEARDSADLRDARDSEARWKDSAAARMVRARFYRTRLAQANERVVALEARGAEQSTAVRQQASGLVVRALPPVRRMGEFGDIRPAPPSPAITYMAPGKDTTRISTLQRQRADGAWIDPNPWLVPTFVVAAYDQAVGTVALLDTVISAQRTRYDLAISLIQVQDSVIVAKDSVISAIGRQVSLLKPSRCGRKCGIAIGIGGTVGGILLLEKARSLLEPRQRAGLHLTARLAVP